MVRTFVVVCLILAAIVPGCRAFAQTYDIVQERNGLVNAFAMLKAGKPTTIAYFGGSITAGKGSSDSGKTSWRALTTAWFRRQYPMAVITEIDASLGDLGSDLGAFRIQHDVLDKKPQLVFIEFAVGDFSAGVDTIDRAVEGIVRHIRAFDPTTEICFIYSLHRGMLSDYKLGRLPQSAFRHEIIAAHYHIASVNAGAVVAVAVNAGKMQWKDFSEGDCVPTDSGHQMYADTLTAFLAEQSLHVGRQPLPYRLVDPLHADAWSFGKLTLLPGMSAPAHGWSSVPQTAARGWDKALEASNPSADPLVFNFTGDSIGMCGLVGPDTGNFEYSIDGAAWKLVKPFDDMAAAAHAAFWMLGSDLKSGPHNISVRPVAERDPRSKGSVTRILSFCTNEPPLARP